MASAGNSGTALGLDEELEVVVELELVVGPSALRTITVPFMYVWRVQWYP